MSRLAEKFLQRHPELLTEDRTSDRVGRFVSAITAPLSIYFRFKVRHWERVPDGACLLVANHSIGAPHEVLLLFRAWKKQFGNRPARGLAHQIGWQLPFSLLPIIPKIGGLFAHQAVAKAALDRGCALLVFPGGDIEALRPFSARYQIIFDGREGFIRLAREAKVPIVPLVICGAHAGFFVLPGTERMARLTFSKQLWGFKAFPLTIGVAISLLLIPATLMFPVLWPLLLIAAIQALIALPTRIEAEVLPAIQVSDGESDTAAAERVRAAMQSAMDRLAATRTTPWG